MRATFDDPNLVSCAGLVPVMRLTRSVSLHVAVTARVHLPGDTGSNPAGKVATIVAGMLAGADSIDELNIARHGGMPSLFTSGYAPSTLARVVEPVPTTGRPKWRPSRSSSEKQRLARSARMAGRLESAALRVVDSLVHPGGPGADDSAGGSVWRSAANSVWACSTASGYAEVFSCSARVR
jgi:hypothetical protein